jgi:hypothetical protein
VSNSAASPGVNTKIVLAEHEPQTPAEDVQPFITLVRSLVGLLGTTPSGRHDMFVGLEAADPTGEGHDGHPIAGNRTRMDAGIAGGWRADKLVDRHLISPSEGQQELEGRLVRL